MELHKHLASCDDCRRIFDDYQRIRTGFRELPPSPPPPPDLARSVWSETVERTPPTRLRRIMGETTTRVGLTTAAVLAVIIVVSAFLLVRGYNQSLPPSATYDVANSGQSWPLYQPIKITFNKPMNQESVLDHLQIFPPGERGRIPLSWEDRNTLIVGASSSQSSLFLPDTSYQVVVLAGARDAYGQALAETVTIPFHTSSIADASRTPTLVGSVTPVGSTEQSQATTVTPPSSQEQTSPAITGANQGAATSTKPPATSATATNTPTPSPTPVQRTATPTIGGGSASTPTPPPMPSAIPTRNAATPAGTPTTAATPSATANATPVPPNLTSTATPDASVTPSNGTATPTVIPVSGAFGSVYWANTDVQSKLGAAQAPEAHLSAAELGFQRGTMYERFDTGEIYVLFADGQWSKYPDTWTAAEGDGGGISPDDPQLSIPKGSFGKVWNSDPLLEKSIGYAVNSDAHVMGGVVQQFANGIMLYSDQGFVYVVYNDGSWTLYPDTSGHGDLITPTPTAGETPISTPTIPATPDASEPVTPEPTQP
jgi:hypothetical protein